MGELNNLKQNCRWYCQHLSFFVHVRWSICWRKDWLSLSKFVSAPQNKLQRRRNSYAARISNGLYSKLIRLRWLYCNLKISWPLRRMTLPATKKRHYIRSCLLVIKKYAVVAYPFTSPHYLRNPLWTLQSKTIEGKQLGTIVQICVTRVATCMKARRVAQQRPSSQNFPIFETRNGTNNSDDFQNFLKFLALNYIYNVRILHNEVRTTWTSNLGESQRVSWWPATKCGTWTTLDTIRSEKRTPQPVGCLIKECCCQSFFDPLRNSLP